MIYKFKYRYKNKWERREIAHRCQKIVNRLSIKAKTSWRKSDEQEDIYIVSMYSVLLIN